MKVLFTYRAKVRQRLTGAASIYRYICTRKLDEKIIQNIRYVKIIVYLCGMKTKNRKRMNKDLMKLLAIIATGATVCGLLLGGTTLVYVGATMYLLPIYVAILGDKYF